jgi:ABC-2 type transport system ATP-binding protein
MTSVVVRDLVKTYRVVERQPGAWGALKNLVRPHYRTVRALGGINFALEAGELMGYIGPNGAGKSTTVKVLAGILVPDSGQCQVLGRVPWQERESYVRHIGVVFGQRTQLWWDLPVIESFDLLRDIYALPQAQYAETLDELIALLQIDGILGTPVRQLSLGQRMRCDLVAALLHRPEVLFLDEPTIGLDATSKLAVREFLLRLRERGITTILMTHDMDDIETLCSRVVLINHGLIAYDGTLVGLRERVSPERYLTVEFADGDAWVDDPDVTPVRRNGQRITLSFDPRRVAAAELIARLAARHAVRDLLVENPPIEAIIARLYAEDQP